VVKRVSADGREVDLVMPGTTIERFRVLTDTLEFIDEPKPEAEPARPSINLDELKERIETIQRENLQRLENDLATLMKYLESQGISTAVLDTLEALKSEQEQSWKSAVERIEKLLEEES
jgi:type I site-specific restriction-modification system R (restriction) subunit